MQTHPYIDRLDEKIGNELSEVDDEIHEIIFPYHQAVLYENPDLLSDVEKYFCGNAHINCFNGMTYIYWVTNDDNFKVVTTCPGGETDPFRFVGSPSSDDSLERVLELVDYMTDWYDTHVRN